MLAQNYIAAAIFSVPIDVESNESWQNETYAVIEETYAVVRYYGISCISHALTMLWNTTRKNVIECHATQGIMIFVFQYCIMII